MNDRLATLAETRENVGSLADDRRPSISGRFETLEN
jgi:hypothetical protein